MNPAKALEILGNPLPQIEIGAFLYAVFIRGESYLLLRDGERAAGEFQKYLSHPGIAVNCPLAALARLQLARAYALTRNTVKAGSTYQDFLALWNDADPNLPILKQAKAEYARLQ